MDTLQDYLSFSAKIPGWTRGEEALALAHASYLLGDGALIVEIGSFLGSGTVLLAGPRRLCGSGMVHCVDPFDASGDAFSAKEYERILSGADRTQRQIFDRFLGDAGLADWVTVHQGGAREIAAGWSAPIDLLFLDGDQSVRGARELFECWIPFLKPGGIVAVHNSNPRDYIIDHDGYRRVAVEEIHPPGFITVTLVGTTTFARKAQT